MQSPPGFQLLSSKVIDNLQLISNTFCVNFNSKVYADWLKKAEVKKITFRSS